jgi:hypothetical protein
MVVVVPMATILVHTLNVLQLVNLNSSFLKAILEKFQHFANSKLRQEYADSISKDIISIWPRDSVRNSSGGDAEAMPIISRMQQAVCLLAKFKHKLMKKVIIVKKERKNFG